MRPVEGGLQHLGRDGKATAHEPGAVPSGSLFQEGTESLRSAIGRPGQRMAGTLRPLMALIYRQVRKIRDPLNVLLPDRGRAEFGATRHH